jgi:nicotinamide-nucleotide amidase
MQAEVINIGDEILIGQINNTNAQWLSKELTKLGFDVKKISVVSDKPSEIENALKNTTANLVVVTGGLGPTLDDLTKQTITRFFEDKLIFHPEIEEHIKKMFERMNYPYTDNNKGQSYLPSKARLLWNHYGTAPGMWLEKDHKVYIFLPGVPFEMKNIFKEEAIPVIKNKFKLPSIFHKTITVFGIGESLLADRIKEWEKQLPKDIKLAYLPHPGRIRLRLSAKGEKIDLLKRKIDKQIQKLRKIIPDLSISEQVEDLVYEVHKKLTETGLKIAFAESCTGGRLVSDLAMIPGASKFLMGGIVAYNTLVKINVLKVNKEIIEKYSVVHEETAKQMAQNVKSLLKADIGMATTGNAGPSKGDSDAEVGTCIIAISIKDKTEAYRYNFGQPREKVINRAVSKAYEHLLKKIEKLTYNVS